MRKELSHMILELHNMRMKPSSVRKKVREPPNVRKELSHMMLEPHNVGMEPSNVRKKNKRTTPCEKRTVICDIRIAQYENETIKCEKKVNEPPNVRKEPLHVMLKLHNVMIESSNVRKK